jgi:hypothetical protein
VLVTTHAAERMAPRVDSIVYINILKQKSLSLGSY